MATALPPVEARDVVRCDFCSLVQFAPSDLAAPCRRCHIRLAWVEVPETTPPAPAPEPERTVTLAQTLRELRLRAGLSQRELARKMGVPRTYCSKVENEKATPTLPSLARVARALGFSLFGLLQLCERRKDESHSAF